MCRVPSRINVIFTGRSPISGPRFFSRFSTTVASYHSFPPLFPPLHWPPTSLVGANTTLGSHGKEIRINNIILPCLPHTFGETLFSFAERPKMSHARYIYPLNKYNPSSIYQIIISRINLAYNLSNSARIIFFRG